MRLKHAAPAVAALVSLFAFSATGQQLQKLPTRHTRQAVVDGSATLVSAMQAQQQLQFGILLPLRNQTAMQSLMQSLYDPTSPNYRQFLTVAQFTDQFGPTNSDYQAVLDFANASGFTVVNTYPNKLLVVLTGTVQQIDAAFNIHMNIYHHPTENRTFFAPDQEPTVNAGASLWHIAGLDSYSIPHAPMLQLTHPNTALSGSGYNGYYLPQDMRAAYYLSTLTSGQTALTGQGQSVGLVQYTNFFMEDVVNTLNGGANSSSTVASSTQDPNNANLHYLSYFAEGQPFTITINTVL